MLDTVTQLTQGNACIWSQKTTVAHELRNNFILTIAMSCKYRPWLASGHVTQMLALLILDKPA